jgi:O-methyltransferase
MSILTKSLAATLWPRYSELIDLINTNAKVHAWIKSISGTTNKVKNRMALYKFLSENIICEGSIDYLEFGVFRGDSIRAWADLNVHKASRFIGFDSFEGLPEPWNTHNPKGTFDVGGVYPQISDVRVQFVKGWFQDTVPRFLESFSPKNRLVIHNDSDLYSSNLYTLTRLNCIMTPGTIIIFDEFTSPLHEFRAFNDYLSAYQRVAKPLVMTDLGDGQGRAEQIAFELL